MLIPRNDTNHIGLIGHTIINYPSNELAYQAVKVMADAGVKLIELQIPFSEPVADGPVFMRANHAALINGVTVHDCFDFMAKVSADFNIPFVFTAYANTLFKKGFEAFIKDAKKAGAKGAIVPDLPVDLSEDYLTICKKEDFAAIQLIPPNISDERLALITKAASGFVYVVARRGVSGSETEFNQTLIRFLNRVRRHTALPIAVGFGIRSAEDIEFLKPYADYAIIGTQAFRVLEDEGIKGLQQFWESIGRSARANKFA